MEFILFTVILGLFVLMALYEKHDYYHRRVSTFLGIKKYTREELCLMFRMPPHVIDSFVASTGAYEKWDKITPRDVELSQFQFEDVHDARSTN